MEFLKKTLITFVLTVAGITISAALFISIFARHWEFSIQLLWQIIAMSAVCSLGNLIFYSKWEISKRQMKIRLVCHYLYINVIVFGGAILMRWLNPAHILQILVMLLLSLSVYVGITTANFKREKKTAEEFNTRLRNLNAGKEEKNE